MLYIHDPESILDSAVLLKSEWDRIISNRVKKTGQIRSSSNQDTLIESTPINKKLHKAVDGGHVLFDILLYFRLCNLAGRNLNYSSQAWYDKWFDYWIRCGSVYDHSAHIQTGTHSCFDSFLRRVDCRSQCQVALTHGQRILDFEISKQTQVRFDIIVISRALSRFTQDSSNTGCVPLVNILPERQKKWHQRAPRPLLGRG